MTALELQDFQKVLIVERESLIDCVGIGSIEMSIPNDIAILGLRVLLVEPQVEVVNPAEKYNWHTSIQVLSCRQDGVSIVS